MPNTPFIALLGHETALQDSVSPTRLRALFGEAALRGIRLCLLHSRDCDLATGRMVASGLVAGAWQRMEIPMPHLVVATAPATRPEHRAVQDWLRDKTRLLAFDILQKHEAAGVLAQSPSLAPHLIPEQLLVDEQLETQLAAWLAGGAMVIKRTDGSLGTGIFFVVPADGGFLVMNDTRSWHGTAEESVARIAGAIRPRMRYRSYIVQRFVDARDTAGQPATIRADIARQPDGGWQLYRLTGRIAIGAKLVSNRAKGSATVDIESFLAARGAANVAEKVTEIHALADAVARRLSSPSGIEHCYEFGLDFAPDRALHLWFLEANFRPLTHGAEVERAGHVLSYWTSLIAG